MFIIQLNIITDKMMTKLLIFYLKLIKFYLKFALKKCFDKSIAIFGMK